MRQQDVIKTADWVIDLGPGGGVNGGEIVVEGTPEDVAACGASFTGQYLRPLLQKSAHPEEPHSGVSRDHPEERLSEVEGASRRTQPSSPAQAGAQPPPKPRRSSRAKSRDVDADQPDLIAAK